MPEAVTYGLATIGTLMVIFALRSMGKKRQIRASGRETARDHIERARQKQGVRDELEALMVDIHRMAKDLGAQLDAKVVRIEKATQEAEQRIVQLQALRQELNQPLDAPPSMGSSVRAQLATPQAKSEQADPLTRQVYALADQGKGPQDIAQQLDEHVGKIELILALRSS